MKQDKSNTTIYGLSREEEEQQLATIIQVAQDNLEWTKHYYEGLAEELKDMLEIYDTNDKEGLALWFNTESRFKESQRDLSRCLKARNKPYFGRIDFRDSALKRDESYYIGRVGISKNNSELLVIDWRAPIASVYYENSMGCCTYEVKNEGTYEIDLKRKRTYEITNDKLIDFFDSDVVANDELLTKYLAKSKKAVLGEIIGTIQKEQNTIIRKSPKTNLIVQGVAGSGKTTVAMHRISYILYNYDMFRPQDFYIIGSNRILLNYITSVLPDLDVYGISQMTMAELFTRLLYEDWDSKTQKIGSLERKDKLACIKGSNSWFHDLEQFCWEYEQKIIPSDDVKVEKNGVLLLEAKRIQSFLKENTKLSTQGKINALNELLLTKLENELSGRYVSYTPEEKKELQKMCRYHFGKDEWKGSIYKLYDEFLVAQNGKGHEISVQDETYDVYDLAALAYLYKRIKEIDGIIEATHVIIDEAQDFGMMAYGALHYCLRGCTYTIMGDVSQNIHFDYGLNDWEELKKLVLTGTYDSFGLLKKSYRNTVEISTFATEILRHGNFPIYPVEPLIRHGNQVCIHACENEETMLRFAIDTIVNWQREGHETIAVICRDEEEAILVSKQLEREITLTDSNLETATFEQGVMVLPVEYTKGLEFDAVLIYHPSTEQYPAQDQYVKLLYVAATRALHELAVVHLGDLTELIAKPVSEEKRMQLLENDNEPKQLEYKKRVDLDSEEKRQRELEQYLQRTKKIHSDLMIAKKEPSSKKGISKESCTDTNQATQSEKSITPSNQTTQSKGAFTPSDQSIQSKDILPLGTMKQAIKESKILPKNTSPYQFNDVPNSSMLYPKGHSRIDSSIRWGKKSKTYTDLSSNYGVLRIIPVSDAILRIQFKRGQTADFTPGYWNYLPQKQVSWNARESTSMYEISTSQLVIRVDKKTGALQFYDKKGTLLLSEKSTLPRQMELNASSFQTWNYFDWQKNEKIDAKGIFEDDLERMNQKARYISFGQRNLRMPLLSSDKGYGLGIAAEGTVMCCNIPMYGPYVYTEEVNQIDYYFMFGGDYKNTLALYQEVTKR